MTDLGTICNTLEIKVQRKRNRKNLLVAAETCKCTKNGEKLEMRRPCLRQSRRM